MALTSRLIPDIVHDSFCSGVHDIDPGLRPEIACVALDWITHMSANGPLFVDGIQCVPAEFWQQAKKFKPIDTSKWIHLTTEGDYLAKD